VVQSRDDQPVVTPPASRLPARLDSCTIDADGASLRFAESGADHSVESSFFGGVVMSDLETTLSSVL
jgi:hypothetical protein